MRPRLMAGLLALILAAACDNNTAPIADPGADSALAWIQQAATPLTALAPTTSQRDLAQFTTMVGTARIIGLGEATHGSREFFTMKDRLLRHLVENAGVTGFAIEASMPEAFAIDTYVRTGVGDPAVLLSHLYFWTWNTQEVADLIAWLREWNRQHPAKQVGFYGFDMQYPGVAIDSVTNYVARVAPSLSPTVAGLYACFAAYRNDTHGNFTESYSAAARNVQSGCGTNISAAYQLLLGQRPALVAASSEREFTLALQMARLVRQYHDTMIRLSAFERDVSMAENIGWLLDREGPGGKLVVWAHNYHISRYPGAMGWKLASTYDADYLPVGFAFSTGGLNAYEGYGKGIEGPVTAPLGSLGPLTAPPPDPGSYEALLEKATAPDYYLDLRQATGAAAAWLNTSHRFRSIGAIYYASDPEFHYTPVVLPNIYDVMIFLKNITPSTLLPFRY